jgi:hypothetical protein
MKQMSNKVIFTGDINGALVKKQKTHNEWLPYKLVFIQVLACFFCELDTYERIEYLMSGHHYAGSSFDLVENSKYLTSLPVREDYDKNSYKHYKLFTYDVVYNIVATDYKLDIG